MSDVYDNFKQAFQAFTWDGNFELFLAQIITRSFK